MIRKVEGPLTKRRLLSPEQSEVVPFWKGRIATLIYGILTASWIGLIFSFSAQNGTESGALSSELTHALLNLLTVIGLASACNITADEFLRIEGILRTFAHFTEFAILGGLVGQLNRRISTRLHSDTTKQSMAWILPIGFCLCIATIDEILQLGSPGRAFQMTDILIDLSGSVVGFMLATFLKIPQRRSSVR
jgi:VanZ family protein